MAEIKLESGDLQAAMSAQILASLDAETRERILTDSVKYLLAGPVHKDSYGRETQGKSPMQQAFDNAVHGLASKIAAELVEQNPEVERRVREAAGGSIIGWMEESGNLYGVLGAALAKAFGEKLTTMRY